ncbi:MAG: Crp/Fnr family transcriptional regulator [Rhodospirillales bacterium]|nr:Crp/Fnr family transcriptional regulator [Rhodospirillales bacterium]
MDVSRPMIAAGAPHRDARWVQAFPLLTGLDAATRDRLAEAATIMTLPAGAATFRPGQHCESYVLVISGVVRVHMISETGREVVLYRIEGGETCILTTACLLANMDYAAEAVAETDVCVAVLPRSAFQDAMARSAVFRDFVFKAFGERIADLLLVVEEVAFRRLDLRLARLLLQRQNADGSVFNSHQELAFELGTVREVISRQLKEFERRGWVVLGRGRIDVRAAAALRDLIRQAV